VYQVYGAVYGVEISVIVSGRGLHHIDLCFGTLIHFFC
jgi:hypothetical protein